MSEQEQFGRILADDDVTDFVEKLSAWGDSLTVGEKALLQIVLERAAGGTPEPEEAADLSFPATGNFGNIVAPFLRDLVVGGALSLQAPSPDERGVWVKIGQIWMRVVS